MIYRISQTKGCNPKGWGGGGPITWPNLYHESASLSISKNLQCYELVGSCRHLPICDLAINYALVIWSSHFWDTFSKHCMKWKNLHRGEACVPCMHFGFASGKPFNFISEWIWICLQQTKMACFSTGKRHFIHFLLCGLLFRQLMLLLHKLSKNPFGSNATVAFR